MTLAPLTSLGLVSSHTNLLAMGQRRYAIKRSKITREANDPAKSRDLLSAYIATDERPSLFRSHRHAPCGDSRLGCPSLGAARRPLPHCRPPADKSE